MRNLRKRLNVVIRLVVAIFSAHDIYGWRGCSCSKCTGELGLIDLAIVELGE